MQTTSPDLPALPPPLGDPGAKPPPGKRVAPPSPRMPQPSTSGSGSRNLRIALVVGAIAVFALVAFMFFAVVMGLRVQGTTSDRVPAVAVAGECYTDDGGRLPVPCEMPHDYEVFGSHSYPADADYPSPLGQFVESTHCIEAFEAYVGTDYDDSIFFITMSMPNERAWEEGARRAACVLHAPFIDELTGTARNSGL